MPSVLKKSRAMNHILIRGRRRSGRSALICSLLRDVTVPVFGYKTVTMGTRPDGYHEIYLYPYGLQNPQKQEANHVADCNTKDRIIHPEVFNTLGVQLLQEPVKGILVMDEIGFMESSAETFCQAILERLDGDIPVLAAVRSGIDTPFLRMVTQHKNAICLEMDPANFEEYECRLRPIIQAWNERFMESNGHAEAY